MLQSNKHSVTLKFLLSHFCLERLHNRKDSEHEQILLRILLVSLLLGYLHTLTPDSHALGSALSSSIQLVTTGLIISFLLLIALLIYPAKSVTRRVLGAVGDMGILSLCMAITNDLIIPWFGIYLWVTFGNGFRYGEKYLYLSSLLSVLGFGYVTLSNPFWQQNTPLAIGLLVTLVVLPGYAAVLIRRLDKSRREAEEANKAKSDFLARMSHEIRTPLNGIIGATELLRSGHLTNEAREYSDTIDASGKALLKLIEDILDISKIEAGKLSIEQTEFDLHTLLHSTVKMLRPQAESKGIYLASRIAIDTPYQIYGDPLHLRHTLLNLIGNAIKFTDKGGVDVHCYSILQDSTEHLIHFEVADSGIGIPEGKQAAIFNKFTQADESTTRRFGGTGLGTAIAKQLVELMGGKIDFSSTLGVGSKFWFEIKFKSKMVKEEQLEPHLLNGCRILHLYNPADTKHPVSGFMETCHIDNLAIPYSDDTITSLITIQHQTPFDIFLLQRPSQSIDLHKVLSLLNCDGAFKEVTLLLIDEELPLTLSSSSQTIPIYSLPHPLTNTQFFNAIRASYSGNITNGHSQPTTNQSYTHSQKQRYKILIAEDNHTNGMLIGRILELAGHHFTLVKNGHEALLKLEECDDFNLVIVDMHMPILGGIETYKTYRFAHTDQNELPFIMLTANATIEAKKESESIGIHYFLTKPISSTHLLETIDNAISGSNLISFSDSQNAPIVESQSNNTIDYKVFNDILNLSHSDDFLQRLYDNFVMDGEQLIDSMQASLKSGDSIDFKEQAHALKGSAAYLGLHKLAAHASTASHFSTGYVAQQGKPQLEQIELSFAEAKTAFTNELNKQLVTEVLH
jgi:two-component system sensor histidine kinase RpfC